MTFGRSETLSRAQQVEKMQCDWDQRACAMAERNGFEPRYRHGTDTQYFWLWYFKKP